MKTNLSAKTFLPARLSGAQVGWIYVKNDAKKSRDAATLKANTDRALESDSAQVSTAQSFASINFVLAGLSLP